MSLDVSLERSEICQSAARKIQTGAAKLKTKKLLLMPDGFVDSIISVVDKRHNPKKFQPIASIDSFGKRVVAAAGQSANFEMWVNLQKLGGNGPIMANALAGFGIGKGVTYVGMVGYPKIH